MSFTTKKFAPFAFLQERTTDFPYAKWDLRCTGDATAILDIYGKRQNFKFEIGAGYAILKDRNEPELAHIVNKKLSPGAVLHVNFELFGLIMLGTVQMWD